MSRCNECNSNNECLEWCGRSKSELQDDLDLYYSRWTETVEELIQLKNDYSILTEEYNKLKRK